MNSKTKKRDPYSNEAPERGKGKKRAPKEITEDYLYNSALFYLQRFAVNTAHFRKVMLAKIKKSCAWHKDQNYQNCIKMLDDLIQNLESQGLLNDTAYTKASVTSMRRQGKSRRAILAKLKSRGLEDTLIEQALEDHDSNECTTPAEADMQAALTFAKRKRLGPFKNHNTISKKADTPEKIFEKSISALGRAGFSFEIAKTVLEMSPEEASERLSA